MSSDESDDGIIQEQPIEEEDDYHNGETDQNNHPKSSCRKQQHNNSLSKLGFSKKISLTSNSRNGRSRVSPSSSSSRTRSVVKLLVNSISHTYSEPWRRQPQSASSGTGFLIRWMEDIIDDADGGDGSMEADTNTNDDDDDGNDSNNNTNTTKYKGRKKQIQSLRILTNAHVVRNASTVRARASFGPHVVSCDVEWLSLPLDLALLKITDGDWMDFCTGWNFGAATAGGSSNATAAALAVDDVDAGANTTTTTTTTTTRKSNNRNNTPSLPPLNCLTLSAKSLPKLDENVTCVGFPQGGTQISVTRGVVSRIDVNSKDVLRIQIDAAINSGNSGGPVFDEEGQVVGIASSGLRGAGNIGYIIPAKIVSMFLSMCMDGMNASLEDRFSGLGSLVEHGRNNRRQGDGNGMAGSGMAQDPSHVPGIPELAIHGVQTLENKALRRSLGLEGLGISGGVRIIGVRASNLVHPTLQKYSDDTFMEGSNDHEDTNDGAVEIDELQANDVLLSINHIPIGMDGTIQLSPTRLDERINFRSVVTCQRVGSKVVLDVLRQGKRKEMRVVLDTKRCLVPRYDGFDACPLYVVCGGCVFSPLSVPLVKEQSTKHKSIATTFSHYSRDQRKGNEQILLLSKVLADDVNVGYHGWSNKILKSVNGHEPKNIQELAEVIVRKVTGEMIEFRCQTVGLADADFVICMKIQDVLQSEQRILQRHMIASWCSTDALSLGLHKDVKMCTRSEADRVVSCSTLSGVRLALELRASAYVASRGPYSNADSDVFTTIRRRSAENKWPVKRKRLEEFDSDELTRLRLHSSHHVVHKIVDIPGENKVIRKSCTLCTGNKGCGTDRFNYRSANKMCSICQVPLCCVVLDGETESHFQRWHKMEDLKEEHAVCNANLVATREQKKEKKKFEGDDEVDEEEDETKKDKMVDIGSDSD